MKVKTMYICDRKACNKCGYPDCRHTSDPNHAVNLKKGNAIKLTKGGLSRDRKTSYYWEEENNDTK